jgi:hypothetical protein
MKLIGLTLALSISMMSHGQVSELDSVMAASNSDKYISRCFDGLRKSSKLDSLELKYGIHFCSITACVNYYTTSTANGQDIELLKLRLEELAERFFSEGNPVFIFLGGEPGYGATNRRNSENLNDSIKYVRCSYGPRTATEIDLEEAFNRRTRQLLGMK